MASAAIIASAGRSELLGEMLWHLVGVKPDDCEVIVCVPDTASSPSQVVDDVKVIVGPRGAAAQRNAAIAEVSAGVSVVFFFDDDAFPHPSYIPNGVRAFSRDAGLAALTGKVAADGVRQGEIAVSEALRILDDVDPGTGTGMISPSYGLYGCNFAVRKDLLKTELFDARLALYSWLEDEDLARRLARHGKLEIHESCVCVHLGANSGGRTGHLRFGYSQITNPVYLWKKGSLTIRRTIYLTLKPLATNALRSLLAGDKASRRERLHGNWMSLTDLARGRVTPERIVDL
jgi:GT2 family glycosyltransferase